MAASRRRGPPAREHGRVAAVTVCQRSRRRQKKQARTISDDRGDRTIDLHFVSAAALALFMLALTTALHHFALQFLGRVASRRRLSRFGVVFFLVALVSVHVVHITAYAVAYAAGDQLLGLGVLRGSSGSAHLDFFYFAAETYSTLGYGDVVPLGALRLLASIESLNGLMLLAWSGAFLYGVLDGQGHHA
jgi:hypothetical protein